MEDNRPVKSNSGERGNLVEKMDFEALCSEIDSSFALSLVKDDIIRGLLNDYYSSVIYPRFAFIAQTNVKKDAAACLAALRRFKNAAALCSRVESFAMPDDAPAYLAADFKVKADYFAALAGGRGISGASGLEEFESVVRALISLYEEKRRHEGEAAPVERPEGKKSVAAVENDAAVHAPKVKKTIPASPQKTRKKSAKKKNGKKNSEEASVEPAEKNDARSRVEIENVPGEKSSEPAKKIRAVPGAPRTPAFALASEPELMFVFAVAGFFAMGGALAWGDAHNASVTGAICGGAFGTFAASFAVNLFKMRFDLLKRDFFILIAIFVLIGMFERNFQRVRAEAYVKSYKQRLKRQTPPAPSLEKKPYSARDEYKAPQGDRKTKKKRDAGRYDGLEKPLIPREGR